jgi:hypothetical protein
MTAYRLPAGPPIALTTSFIQTFAVNLESPGRGPFVPIPASELSGQESRFESRPFRSSPDAFLQFASELGRRLPDPDWERPLNDIEPSQDGLRWYLTSLRCEPERELLSFILQQMKEPRGKGPRGRFVSVNASHGVVEVSVSKNVSPHAGVTQESLWGREGDRNMNLLRTVFFSKKGPPIWGDLSLPLPEIINLLSLALYGALDGEGLRVQVDRHWGPARESWQFESAEEIAAWISPAFVARESGSVRTLRRIRWRDQFGIEREEPVVYVRWFQPWKRAPWYLEINDSGIPGLQSPSGPMVYLARRVLEGARSKVP